MQCFNYTQSLVTLRLTKSPHLSLSRIRHPWLVYHKVSALSDQQIIINMVKINDKKWWRDSVVVWPDVPHMFDIPASRNRHWCSFSSRPITPPLEEGWVLWYPLIYKSCLRASDQLKFQSFKYSGLCLWLWRGADSDFCGRFEDNHRSIYSICIFPRM